MLDVIEKLLVLQDRDRKILQVQTELSNVGPERESLQNRAQSSQETLDAAKLRVKQIETERKELELEVEAKKQLIDKYSIQQFQTKKNDEYRALANEIANCKAEIVKLEDQQLELMEKGEVAQKELAGASGAGSELKKQVQTQLTDLADREQKLEIELSDLESDHDRLIDGIDESTLLRYQRLRKQKGPNTVVGIEHSVCGGCHMKLPTQIVISCQAQQELVACPNCGRILYYARHMDLAVAD